MKDADTNLGGSGSRFPDTRISVIREAAASEAEARARGWERLVQAYWKPVYRYIRIRWRVSNDEAEDLTQAFFARAIEKESFRGYDPGKGTFRTYVRSCLDHFLANEKQRSERLKRGGGAAELPLNFDVAADETAGESFDKEWVRGLFEMALDRLRAECARRGRCERYRIFERYDLPEGDVQPTYSELAAEFGTTAVSVTNQLAAARRDFRRYLLDALRDATADEREFRAEARNLLGFEFKEIPRDT
jgi:RNA polymerase sigma factor (sigma-70 family)